MGIEYDCKKGLPDTVPVKINSSKNKQEPNINGVRNKNWQTSHLRRERRRRGPKEKRK